jgi:hypothetical protein
MNNLIAQFVKTELLSINSKIFGLNPKIAIIQNTQMYWDIVDSAITQIYTSLYINNINISIHDLNTSSSTSIYNQLKTLYDTGIRYFVGFASSKLLDSSRTFFVNYNDAYGISVGSTMYDTTLPNNIIRPVFNDNKYILAIKSTGSLDTYTSIIRLVEQNNIWADKFSESIDDNFDPEILPDPININLTDIEASRILIYNMLDNYTDPTKQIVAPLVSLNVNTFITIILDYLDSHQTPSLINMFCGDNLYGFEQSLITQEKILFTSRINLLSTSLFGRGSIYSSLYNPLAINLIDMINVINKTSDTKDIYDILNLYTGYNGYIKLDTDNTKLYGKILIIRYLNISQNVGWYVTYISEKETSSDGDLSTLTYCYDPIPLSDNS